MRHSSAKSIKEQEVEDFYRRERENRVPRYPLKEATSKVKTQ